MFPRRSLFPTYHTFVFWYYIFSYNLQNMHWQGLNWSNCHQDHGLWWPLCPSQKSLFGLGCLVTLSTRYSYYPVYTVPRFRGRTREVGQICLGGGGGFHWPAFTQLKEQTPQLGQNEWAQVQNFSCYTWKSSIHCGGRPGFLFTQKKMRCQTPHLGSNPTHLEEHKRRVRPHNRGRWIPFTLRGKRRGLTPHLGFDPAIGALCKRGIFVQELCPRGKVALA